MSKKSFILTALILNFLICLTICIMSIYNPPKEKLEDSKNVAVKDTNKIEDEVDSEDESYSKEDNTTSSEEKESTLNKTSQENTTSQITSHETTTPQITTSQTTAPQPNTQETTTQVINGTKAVIISSVNVRSTPDVSGEVIGVAKTGNVYSIDKARVTDNWIAIVFDNNVVGYISDKFCNIE